MCGIVAVVSREKVATKLLLGLKKLEYRGYDSCGIVTIDNNQFTLLKNIGSIEEVNIRLNFLAMPGVLGIAHTRWATHGRVTNANSHPLVSNDNKFAIVHNGIISNYEEIKKNLMENGYSFSSETDSEVIANLLQFYFAELLDVKQAFTKTISRLEGCYSIAMCTTHEKEKIYATKFLLPLVIGKLDGTTIISSDILGFNDFTNQAIKIEDNQYVIITADDYKIFNLKNELVEPKKFTIEEYSIKSDKGEFAHYMLKEIYDQPQAIRNALSIDQNKIIAVAKQLIDADYTYLVGIGTTYYVAKAASYILNDFANCFTSAVPADEFNIKKNTKNKNFALFISQSGETYDTKEALKLAIEHNMTTAAIVNSPNSTIAHAVDNCIYQNSGVEVSVVSTKAAVAQLAIIYRLAYQVALIKGLITIQTQTEFIQKFESFASKLENILTPIAKECHSLAKNWSKYNHFLILGKGIYYPIALETSLKIKEVSYIHAEGMPTGFLKHGTLALIDEKTPCIFFVPPKSNTYLYNSTLAAIEEVRSRFGLIIGFCDTESIGLAEKFNASFIIPHIDDTFYPIYQLIVSQLFAYYLALELKRPIDKPRNLAKSVTVP